MAKVLLIGGSGFIGARLHQYLLQQGVDVTSADLELFGHWSSLPHQQEDFADLTKEVLAQYRTVILLAGHSSVKMCVGNMRSTFNNNVVNFISLINKLTQEQQLIYASSSSIYGGLSDEMICEDTHKYRALNFYDLSKYEIDSYAKLHDSVEFYGLRFGTVNGFSLNCRDDIMLNAMFKTAQIEGIVKITNPSIHRPILSLNDLCRAIYNIIREGTFATRGIYNLASFNATVKDISQRTADYMHARLIVSEDLPNAYDFTISTKKFNDTFGFSFQETIETILEELHRGQAQINFTNRNTAIKYGPQS